MSNYTRKTFYEFIQPVTADEVTKIVAMARGHICHGSMTSFADDVCEEFLSHIPVPRAFLKKVISHNSLDDVTTIALQLSDWITTATDMEKYTEVSRILLTRTEHATSDKIWETNFAREISRVFGLPIEVGMKTIQTPAKSGRIWVELVAEATARIIFENDPVGPTSPSAR